MPFGEDVAEANAGGEETVGNSKELIHRATTIVEEVQRAIEHFKNTVTGAPAPAIGVVVNRVARARVVFEQLGKEFQEQVEAGSIDQPILMIGPARPVDRDELVTSLEPIRTRNWEQGERRSLDKTLILVATQCIEVGVDIDLDGLITEAAPLDCLRQRFGRLNRAGREITPFGAIIAAKSDLSARTEDSVYGNTIKPAWDCLMDAAKKEGHDRVVEFGLSDFTVTMRTEALARKDDAPILLPAHLDLLSQTSPVSAADPEVGLYLHGKKRQPDSMVVIWRADIDPENSRGADIRRLLTVAPPRSLEAIELPLWVVRRWLTRDSRGATDLADVATAVPEEDEHVRPGSRERIVFRWKGNDERSRWINPAALRPGDTIIVPARYGGVDEFGWNPEHEKPATDVGRIAAEPFAGRRFAVRVTPGLLGRSMSGELLADTLASAASQRWQDLRAALADLDLPEDVRNDLVTLDDANRKRSVTAYLDLYGLDDERPRGVVFVAPFGIKRRKKGEDGSPNTTEDDISGSISGFPLSLQQHSQDVEQKAEIFAKAAGLSADRIADVQLAGFLHDAGKADRRFQAWLHYGDPLGPDQDDQITILAKSGRLLPPAARAQSGLPEYWRHEALSVRFARGHERLTEAHDPDLVLWLVGSHHGHGRPFFPHRDPNEQVPDVGPQSLAFDWNGLDWPSLFVRLKARYGVWELARMEAILRLADHRASEERVKESAE